MPMVMLAAALVALTGCYEVEREIIPGNLGEVIPYRNNPIPWAEGGQTWLSPSGAGNDYRFEDRRDGEDKTGTLRAMRVVRDIFAVQLRYDDENSYYVLFYRATAAQVRQVEVASEAEMKALARRFRVTVDDDGFGSTSLSGTPADLLAFIRGHAQLAFRDVPPRR
jgi:hypothetical protein